MALTNLHFGWAWILTGLIAGAVIGVFFHKPDWLDGYDSWPRRMLRLGHIAFVGTGLLNIAFALSAPHLADDGVQENVLRLASVLFIIGAATMPTICLLSAWRQPFRNLFFIPTGCLIAACGTILLRVIQS